MNSNWIALFGSFLALVFLNQYQAQGIPAFARREGVNCTMCHFRLPELNEDGHAYIRRGLREEPPQPGKAKIPADTRRPLGEVLQLEWSNYLTMMGHHMLTARRGAKAEFDAGVVDLWVGGPLNPNWSGLANPAVDIEEGGIDVEQAYGQYITRWQERFGSARGGQLMPFAILFNQGGPSMALSTPIVLSAPADTGNPWTPTTFIRGVEAGYVDLPRWNVYAGVGQPHLEAAEGVFSADASLLEQSGFPRHTDLFGSAEYLFTEEGNSVTVYGYVGSSPVLPTGAEHAFHRIGVFGNVYGPETKGTFGYLRGSDDTASGGSLGNSGLFGLVEQLLTDQWAAYFRYDWFRRDRAGGDRQTVDGPAFGVSWWAQTQVRVTVEARFLNNTGMRQDRQVAGELMWAF